MSNHSFIFSDVTGKIFKDLIRSLIIARKFLFRTELWRFLSFCCILTYDRPGCQNRKCTYVNNRGIRSRNIRIINLNMDGLNECNCDAHKKQGAVKLLYNSVMTGSQYRDQTRWWQDAVEKASIQQIGPQAPGWAAQENGKETRLWPIEWGSICCSSVRSPTPSHTQHFQ